MLIMIAYMIMFAAKNFTIARGLYVYMQVVPVTELLFPLQDSMPPPPLSPSLRTHTLALSQTWGDTRNSQTTETFIERELDCCYSF